MYIPTIPPLLVIRDAKLFLFKNRVQILFSFILSQILYKITKTYLAYLAESFLVPEGPNNESN